MFTKLQFALLGLFLLISPAMVSAQTSFNQGKTVILAANETVTDNYFAVGDSVRVDGKVTGDVYLAGGDVTVTGIVNGDVLAAGGNIDIQGTVTGNVRIVGGQLKVSGKVGKNITAIGGNIFIAEKALVGGSFTAAGGDIQVASPLGRGLQVAGGRLTITSAIPANVTFAGGALNLFSGGKIAGDLTYYSDQEAVFASGATVSGQVSRITPPRPVKSDEAKVAAKTFLVGLVTAWTILKFLSLLVIGLLMVHFLPNHILHSVDRLQAKFWTALGVGFLAVILTPPVVLVLFLTLIGFPLGLTLIALLLISLYAAKILASLYIGRLVLTKLTSNTSPSLAFVVGLLLYFALGLVPVLGSLTCFVLTLAALGAMLAEEKAICASLGAKKLI